MTGARALLAAALIAPFGAGGCGKKSDGAVIAASATAAAPAPCPPGSMLVGSSCNGAGTSHVATVKWSGGPTGDKGPTFAITNTTPLTLKGATVSIWFYDKTGTRLDVTGARKYSTPAANDAFGTTPLKPGETRSLATAFSSAIIPTGAVEIEAEVVKATIVKPDGTDGPTWHNDDLNADARTMTGTIPVAASATATAAALATAPRPVFTATAAPTVPATRPRSWGPPTSAPVGARTH